MIAGVLPERADVVVVGGGVMGAAALHYLAELGCPSAVLLERDTLGTGSTGHCAGGVRTLFSDELNVRIGLESHPPPGAARRTSRAARPAPRRLPLPARRPGRPRAVRGATSQCSRLVGIDTRLLDAGRGGGDRAAARDRRSLRRRLQPARRHGDAGLRRAGLRAAARRRAAPRSSSRAPSCGSCVEAGA